MDGTFSASGSPVVEIEVSGPLKNLNPAKFTAIVDTGFSGFLLLPILSAFPIGLVLHSMMSVVLADGTTQTKLTCLGGIHFDGKYEIGVVIVEWQNTDVLVGMEFLAKFGKQLVVDPVNRTVKLVAAPKQDHLPLAPPKS